MIKIIKFINLLNCLQTYKQLKKYFLYFILYILKEKQFTSSETNTTECHLENSKVSFQRSKNYLKLDNLALRLFFNFKSCNIEKN